MGAAEVKWRRAGGAGKAAPGSLRSGAAQSLLQMSHHFAVTELIFLILNYWKYLPCGRAQNLEGCFSYSSATRPLLLFG